MKIGITGSEGQLGSRLVKLYGAEPLLCDVRSRSEVESEISRVQPKVIIHLAGHSSVDWCEENYDDAVATNVFGTSLVCQVAHDILGQGKVVLVSTDQVFNGDTGYYKEDDEPDPINNYGLTKLAAEGVARMYDNKVVRISRCFDSKSKDIADYLYQLGKQNKIVVPEHIERSYCHLDFMAEALYNYATRFNDMPEILHIAGAFPVTFHSFMMMVAREHGFSGDMVVERREMKGFAPRPAKCGLNVNLATSLALPIYHPRTSVEQMKHERL